MAHITEFSEESSEESPKASTKAEQVDDRREQERSTGRPSHVRFVVGILAALALIAGVVVAAQYRRQIWSYLTTWKGAPSETVPYQVPLEEARFRLLVAGDVGDSGRAIDATGRDAALISEAYQPYDALLLLGDNVYPSGDPAKLPGTVFEPFRRVLDSGAQLLAILGNHDVLADHADAQLAALGMPGRWWSHSFDSGRVLIVGLDSNDVKNAAQLRWLEATLAASEADLKIAALHHAPYSAGYQGSSLEARRVFGPLFERYGVQLVFSGHDHDYQRNVPQQGVTYIVSGAASGTRRTAERDFTAVSFAWRHFLDVSVFEDRVLVRAVGQDTRVGDEVTLPFSSASGPTGAQAHGGQLSR